MNVPAYLRFLVSWPKLPIATARFESVFRIDFATLKSRGIDLLIFDVDDTLTAHYDVFSPETLALLRRLKTDFRLAIASNCKASRRAEIIAAIGDLVVSVNERPDKPAATPFKRILKEQSLPASQAAMIGDRVGMDLAGAAAAGIPVRILVQPFSDTIGGQRAAWPLRFIRMLENTIRR